MHRLSTHLLWILTAALILACPGVTADVVSAVLWSLQQPALIIPALALTAWRRHAHSNTQRRRA